MIIQMAVDHCINGYVFHFPKDALEDPIFKQYWQATVQRLYNKISDQLSDFAGVSCYGLNEEDINTCVETLRQAFQLKTAKNICYDESSNLLTFELQ